MSKIPFPYDPQILWHHLPHEQVLDELASTMQGLSYVMARRRLRQMGPNVAAKVNHIPRILGILTQSLRNPVTYFIAGGAVYIQWQQPQQREGWAFLLVVLLHGILGIILGFWIWWTREHARLGRLSKTTIEQLQQTVTPITAMTVYRDGEPMELPSRDVVVGDVLQLRAGDVLTVDVRLLNLLHDQEPHSVNGNSGALPAKNFLVNQSALGGDSLTAKYPSDDVPEYTTMLERHNMVYASSEVMSGQAIGVVVATGKYTYAARLQQQEPLHSIMHQQLDQIRLVSIGVASLIMVFIVGLLWSQGVFVALTTGLAVAVSTYPQNLLRVATQTQLLAMYSLAKQRFWVRSPQILDALARLRTIAVVLESDTVLSIQALPLAGIEWEGLLKASPAKTKVLAESFDIPVQSYDNANPQLIRQWQGLNQSMDAHPLPINQLQQRRTVGMIANAPEDIPLLRLVDVAIVDRTCRREVRDCAGVVLPKEDLYTLAPLILESRGAFDRLQRVVTVWVAGALTIAVLAWGDVIAGILPQPMQLLWVGSVVTPLVAMMLVFEPTRPDLLAQPAYRFATFFRRSNYFRLGAVVCSLVAAVSAVFWLRYLGNREFFAQARTMAFATLGFGQIFHAYALAQKQFLKNIPLLVTILILGGLQFALVQVPTLGDWFITVPLSFNEWLIVLIAATTGFWVQELAKSH
ncbi:MAG: cation transporting ATPase C-terminal domain-containing protein [Pseudanabaena sp. ELA607]